MDERCWLLLYRVATPEMVCKAYFYVDRAVAERDASIFEYVVGMVAILLPRPAEVPK